MIINNPTNELSKDDENYVFLYDSSYTDDDNHDYDENVDTDPLLEKQMKYVLMSNDGSYKHHANCDG